MLQAASFVDQFGWRVAQIALPIVAIRVSGTVAIAGVVGAATGVPSLTSPWWAHRPRRWVAAGQARRLAAVYLACGAVSAMLPLTAATHTMPPALLAVVGCATGVLGTLAAPTHSALIADLADRTGPNGAARMLAWQDGGQRTAMMLGPVTAALLIGAYGPTVALAADSASYFLAGLLMTGAAFGASGEEVGPQPPQPPRASRGTSNKSGPQPPQPPQAPGDTSAPRIRDTMAGHPDIALGWLVRGAGCFGWFAFSLGIPMLGTGLAAVALTVYGAAGLLATPVAARAGQARRPARVAAFGWLGGGTAFVLIGAVPTPVGVTIAGAVAGLSVPVGNAAVTALLTRAHTGEMRRTALAGQQTVVNAASTAGLAVGATVLGALGARTTLVVVGTAIAGVAAFAVFVRAAIAARQGRDSPHRSCGRRSMPG
ncbi:hypothetical protein KGQ20_37610 [Catenulispora sp. NF23]|uniref:hypothetical protein n=1 Tax=Catenulispora pinistramenti TaxID=2705254 RepID=UPI001BAC62DB|nr:hypothetical protein [Catenulispora pinistramenti]MBS2538481.1 hypothetical protein [Catenulispora pinistramenti]